MIILTYQMVWTLHQNCSKSYKLRPLLQLLRPLLLILGIILDAIGVRMSSSVNICQQLQKLLHLSTSCSCSVNLLVLIKYSCKCIFQYKNNVKNHGIYAIRFCIIWDKVVSIWPKKSVKAYMLNCMVIIPLEYPVFCYMSKRKGCTTNLYYLC